MNISQDLAALRLHYLAENYDDFMTHAQSKKLNAEAIIARIVELELLEKNRRSTESRLKSSQLGSCKSMQDFDWNWPEEIDRTAIEKALSCEFIAKKSNVIIGGAQGLGKTMIARNIGRNAIMKGYRVRYTSASRLTLDLGAQESTAALERRLRLYVNPDLLIVDEIGYLSFDQRAADFFFEIINRRYEQGSILMTTNLAFKDWNTVFPGAPCLTAMIDRLTHHIDVIKVTGKSFRSHERQKRITI